MRLSHPTHAEVSHDVAGIIDPPDHSDASPRDINRSEGGPGFYKAVESPHYSLDGKVSHNHACIIDSDSTGDASPRDIDRSEGGPGFYKAMPKEPLIGDAAELPYNLVQIIDLPGHSVASPRAINRGEATRSPQKTVLSRRIGEDAHDVACVVNRP
jgi:hypothetical protein